MKSKQREKSQMDFKESQKDMNASYYSGATGVLTSGFVWCTAGVVGSFVSQTASMIALFIGGMLIFPLSVMSAKMLGRSGKHSNRNALRHLAIEGLAILFVGLFLAFIIAQFNTQLFYPCMLLIIGARYLSFQTLYGLTIYWFLGGVLIIAGFVSALFNFPFIFGAYAGGIIEVLFALVMLKQNNTNAAAAN